MKTDHSENNSNESENRGTNRTKLPGWATILIFVLALALSVLLLDFAGERFGWSLFGANTQVATEATQEVAPDTPKMPEQTEAATVNGDTAANSADAAPVATEHGDFGTKAVFISPDASSRTGLPVGFWLLEVLQSRAAYQAGLRKNDVILQLDEVEAIRNYGDDIIAYRATLQIGDRIRVEYWDYDTGEIRSMDVECTPSDGLLWMNEQSVIDAIFPPATEPSAAPAPTEDPVIHGVDILSIGIVSIYQTPKLESRYTISDLIARNTEWAAVGIADNPSQVAGSNGELTLENQANNMYSLVFDGTESFDLITSVGTRREETHWVTNLVRDDMIRAFNEEWGWGIRIYRGVDGNLYMCYFSSEYNGRDITDFVVFISGAQ